MKEFFIKWLINILALFVVVHVVAGVSIDGMGSTVAAALVIGLLNAFLRPLVLLLTLPFTILSLGLFTLVVNGFMFYIASKFVKGFVVADFWSAFWAALLFSIISFLLSILVGPKAGIHLAAYSYRSSNKTGYGDVIDVEGKIENPKSEKRLKGGEGS